MNTAFAILRVSTASQVEGYSLDAQRREIGRWCESRGYSVRFFVEDGVSARTDKLERRPQLQAILTAAGRHEFDLLVVHMLDRLARNQGVQRRVMEALGKNSIGFATVVEGYDYTTPSGKLIMSVMGSVNEFFSDQLGVHVSKSARERAQTGIPVGPVPFGYRRLGDGAIPQQVESEANALVDAFRARAAGTSMGDIARSLNDSSFVTREGKAFTAHALRDILENPFYHGMIRYRHEVYAGKHLPVVSKELFDRVQAQKGPVKAPRKVWGSAGLLQGMIACGNCGSMLQSDRHRFGGPMYRERHANVCETNGRSSVAGIFDDQIAKVFGAIELPASWRDRMAKLTTRGYDGPTMHDLQEKRRKLGIAYADGAFSDREYKARKVEIDDRIRAASAVVPPSYVEAAELFENIEVLWKEATGEERRRLLSPLIERVYVNMELKLVGAIVPTPAFRALLQCAVRKSRSDLVVVSQDELERLGVWSWWRRGGFEPPVQKKNVQDLLQA
jgi:site-specific DNA recombinase